MSRKFGYTSKLAKEGGWDCICGSNFRTRALLNEHKKSCSFYKDHQHYNQYTKAKILGLPMPKYEVSEETRKKLSENNGSHKAEVRQKISESMKKAHAEGRAHNIGECRWSNEHSYPEKWFIKVLENEFNLKENEDYKTELPFHKYSLDFAWENEKLCIEIDGEQHQKPEQSKRDKEKDKLLEEEGWKEIRKDWKEIFNNPKEFIEEVKVFLTRRNV